ncbi:MAG: TIM barrel protein [Sphingomicrobium sp.]
MSRLGIELLSVFGTSPVDQIGLAADLGCSHISTGLTPFPVNPHGYEPWSLKDDPALRREMITAMRDRGVAISLGEGFAVRPGIDIRDRADELDLMAELGAACIGGVAMEPDMARCADQFAALVEMGGERGLQVTIEFAPVLPVSTLDEAHGLVTMVGRPNFGVLVDAMHFFRSGGDVATLAAMDPALIRYAQLCDAPLIADEPDYMREATFERRIPGEGEFPLAAFVAALPRDVVIGLEIPMLARAQAGITPAERLRPAVEAALHMIGKARNT